MCKYSTRRIIAVLAMAGMLSACADTYQPVIDPKGVDMGNYQNDLLECRQLAQQVDASGNTATDAGIGALGGAALGAVVGAIGGNAGAGAAIGGVTGLAGGAASGGISNTQRQKMIINRCLIGRGYKVLG